MYEAGRRTGPVELLVHPPAAFLRNYVLRRGFLDGTAGLTISLMNAWGVALKFMKCGSFSERPGTSSDSQVRRVIFVLELEGGNGVDALIERDQRFCVGVGQRHRARERNALGRVDGFPRLAFFGKCRGRLLLGGRLSHFSDNR
jgi:hypothetical protein